ncbi:MAG: YciI family protein [Planctomycetota bacterium]|nr:YciI family protein [Planctomycetota bacterium]
MNHLTLSGLASFVAALALAAGLFGCAGPAVTNSAEPAARYTLVYLVTGPTSATNTPAQKQEIFRGHMANMQRLAAEKSLILAGPFGKPTNPAWRGLFVFDVPTKAQALALASTDPGVVAGEFALEAREFDGSPALRGAPAIEDAYQAELKSQGQPERKPGEPPPGIRRYAIVHADDFTRARRAMSSLPAGHAPRVIWSGAFADSPGGVFILDVPGPDEARAALADADLGPVTIDLWASTASLPRLPASAAH